MLRQLERNDREYDTFFMDFFQVDRVKTIVQATNDWFLAPPCAQLFADTSRRPIAVYPQSSSHLGPVTYLPVIDGDPNDVEVPNSGPTPIPLILQNQGIYQWFTVELKRSVKNVWPIVNTVHALSLEQKALSLGKIWNGDDGVKSFWNKHLSFKKHVPAGKCLEDQLKYT